MKREGNFNAVWVVWSEGLVGSRDMSHGWALPSGDPVTQQLKGTELLDSGIWGQSSDFLLTTGGSVPAADAATHALPSYFLQTPPGF